jgi:hypothetical protein
MEELIKTRGPITAYSIGRILNMKRSKVNAILHANRHFVKTEKSPLSHVTARPVWSWSSTVVPLPVRRVHINSRNKAIRRASKKDHPDEE